MNQRTKDFCIGQKSPGRPTPTRAIDPDVLEVLSLCTMDDRAVFLPNARLDRDLYVRINAVLEDLGGKWNKKLKGHIFEEDPRDAIWC